MSRVAMRAFVAIDLPAFDARRSGLPIPGESPRHLTLRFFADLPEAALPSVERGLSAAAGASPPFRLALAGVGAFPDAAHPRIGFAELARGRAEVIALARRVDAALGAIGIPLDPRPFRPHVTLVRVRTAAQASAVRAAAGRPAPGPLVEVDVREIVLVESELGPGGPRHTPRARVPLSG